MELYQAREGHPIKLVAKAQGTPTPSIKWKKDGKEITRTNRSYQQLVTGELLRLMEIQFLKINEKKR